MPIVVSSNIYILINVFTSIGSFTLWIDSDNSKLWMLVVGRKENTQSNPAENLRVSFEYADRTCILLVSLFIYWVEANIFFPRTVFLFLA